MKKYKIPVILYESEEQVIPYVEVEVGEEMAPTIFIQEYKHTDTFEPDENGDEQAVIDITMHMFVDMETLSKKLGEDLYDQVRVAFGLQPVKKARSEGQKILDKVYKNANSNLEQALTKKKNVKEDLAKKLNEKLTDKFYKSEEKK